MSKALYVVVNICWLIVLLLLYFSKMYLGMHTLNQVLLSLGLRSFILYIFIVFVDQPVDSSVIWTEWWIIAQREVEAQPKDFAHIRCFLDCGVDVGFFGIILGVLSSNGSYTETASEINTYQSSRLY